MSYVPNTPAEQQEMLRAIGARSVEDLLAAIPEEVRLRRPLDLPKAMSEADVRRWIAQHLIPGADVTVAVLNGEIVGLMALSRDDDAGWIDQLYLHPEATGQGIGGQLVTRAKARLGSPIRLYAFQANEGARRFYERHGFRAVEFGDGSQNEEQCPDVLYEWRV